MRAAVDHPYDVLKPFLWIAGLALASGFLRFVSRPCVPAFPAPARALL